MKRGKLRQIYLDIQKTKGKRNSVSYTHLTLPTNSLV